MRALPARRPRARARRRRRISSGGKEGEEKKEKKSALAHHAVSLDKATFDSAITANVLRGQRTWLVELCGARAALARARRPALSVPCRVVLSSA